MWIIKVQRFQLALACGFQSEFLPIISRPADAVQVMIAASALRTPCRLARSAEQQCQARQLILIVRKCHLLELGVPSNFEMRCKIQDLLFRVVVKTGLTNYDSIVPVG